MKESVLQSTKQLVSDNRYYIHNIVAAYLLNLVRFSELGYYDYLTDDEIIEYERAPLGSRLKTEEGVEKFIRDNFNFDASEIQHEKKNKNILRN